MFLGFKLLAAHKTKHRSRNVPNINEVNVVLSNQAAEEEEEEEVFLLSFDK